MRTTVVRSATLLGYLSAAKDVGIDGRALLASVGLRADFADNPDRLIPVDTFIRLLDLSCAASGVSDFGARAAIARGVPDYGPVSLLLREEETLGDALRTISARQHHHSDGVHLELDLRFGKPFMVFRIVSNLPAVQASEFCACGLVQMIRWLIGPDWNPDAVCFEHSPPTQTSVLRNFMRCELRYSQVMSGILLDREALSRQVVTSSAVLRRHAKRLVEHALSGAPDHFEVQVARLISQQLRESTGSADRVAASLGMNRRTLHRRLTDKGLSYSILLQEVRCDTARRLVEAGNVPLSEVADATGFASLSAFSRWFRTSFGCSASDWKHNGRVAQ
ncbi:AraC family transcriptional regulator [Pandoraea captiosa]|uniref:AraC family transcriptional regulator n=1 Tax=Pandoraea captiosa TaxID=2508302 RepID=A0A5E4ZKR9_9BURK|nr:AraC family transcriptional regulator [Pandoraea captiosa]VVE61277.1 AraC family transcriptional regulator [Pandoraea captiosa]